VIFIGTTAPKSAFTILRQLQNNLNPTVPRRTNKIRPARAGRFQYCGPGRTIEIVRPGPKRIKSRNKRRKLDSATNQSDNMRPNPLTLLLGGGARARTCLSAWAPDNASASHIGGNGACGRRAISSAAIYAAAIEPYLAEHYRRFRNCVRTKSIETRCTGTRFRDVSRGRLRHVDSGAGYGSMGS